MQLDTFCLLQISPAADRLPVRFLRRGAPLPRLQRPASRTRRTLPRVASASGSTTEFPKHPIRRKQHKTRTHTEAPRANWFLPILLVYLRLSFPLSLLLETQIRGHVAASAHYGSCISSVLGGEGSPFFSRRIASIRWVLAVGYTSIHAVREE